MPKQILTQSRLKELLKYDPDTGVFTWLVNRMGGVKAGDIAGWVDDGYSRIEVDLGTYKAHRLAFLYMTGGSPQDGTDHIDGDRGNNKWANLRDVNHTENMRNTKMMKNNTSGVTGVHRDGKYWTAKIGVNGKQEKLYMGNSFYKAQFRRKMAEIKYGYHENHGKTAEARLI